MPADPIQGAKEAASLSLGRARSADAAKASAASGRGVIGEIAAASAGMDGQNRAAFAHAGEQYRANTNWVYACTRLVSQRIAGQTVHVAREVDRRTIGRRGQKDGLPDAVKHSLPEFLKADADRLEPLDSHPLLDSLDNPNVFGTRWGLFACSAVGLEVTGHQLWWCPVEDGRRSILPIPTTWIDEVDARRTVWTIRPSGSAETQDLPGEEVVHLFYPDPADPFSALSPLQRNAEAVVADQQIAMAQRQAFRNGIFPRKALRVGKSPDLPGGTPGRRQTLTPDQRKQIISAIKAVYGGVVNYDQPMILDGMIEEVFDLSIGPKEMDFLGSSKVTKSRILQGFGVSPILLGEVEGANRASATVADDIFCSNKINPIIELLSQSLTKWLGPLFAEPNEKLVVWIERAKARDPLIDLQKYKLLADKEAITVNELRRAYNLPDIDGGDVLISARPSAPAVASPSKAAGTNGHADPVDPLGLFLNPRLNPYTLQNLRS